MQIHEIMQICLTSDGSRLEYLFSGSVSKKISYLSHHGSQVQCHNPHNISDNPQFTAFMTSLTTHGLVHSWHLWQPTVHCNGARWTLHGSQVAICMGPGSKLSMPLLRICRHLYRGGPNSNDYSINRNLHHTIGVVDFSSKSRVSLFPNACMRSGLQIL